MKEILKNRKGFTLIELLAVIVILAILVMVAIPAITKILTDSRKGTYADTALAAINAVRNDFLINGNGTTTIYTLGTTDGKKGDLVPDDNTNSGGGVLEKKLVTSPFGSKIVAAKVTVTVNDDDTSSYTMCIWDEKGNGFAETAENSIDKGTIKLAQGSDKTC